MIRRSGTGLAARNQLRLGFVLPRLAGGGVERVMLTLADALLERGHRVDLLPLRCQGPYRTAIPAGTRVYAPWRPDADRDLLRHCRERGIGTRLLPLNPVAVARMGLALRLAHPEARVGLGNAFEARAVARYVREVRPQLLLSALPRADAAALYGTGPEGAFAPVVVAVHNNIGMAYSAPQIARAKALYPRADALVAVSRGVARELARALDMDEDGVHVIPNPVPLSEIERLGKAEAPHPWFGEGEPPVILSVMRASPPKDPGTLIDAFARVRRRRSARLAFLGAFPKPYRAELRARAARLGVADDLAFPGFDENPYRYMRRAAVVALSSRWEGLPLTLVEAMACGTPVVSTDSPHGPREILEDGRWGALVPVGDAAALARALEETLAGGRPPADALVRRAGGFSPERAAAAYEDLFRAVIANAPPA